MGRQKKFVRQVQWLFVELFTITYQEITSDLVEKIEKGVDINKAIKATILSLWL